MLQGLCVLTKWYTEDSPFVRYSCSNELPSTSQRHDLLRALGFLWGVTPRSDWDSRFFLYSSRTPFFAPTWYAQSRIDGNGCRASALRMSFIASLGQTDAQRPQPRHILASTTATASTVMHLVGQRSRQVPQAVHSSSSTLHRYAPCGDPSL